MTTILETAETVAPFDPAPQRAAHRRGRDPRSGRTWRAGRTERATRVRRLRRVLSGALLAITALAAVAGALLVVTLRLSFAPVLSPSMEPAFGPGDLVVTRPLNASEIEVGDVLVLPIPANGKLSGTEGASGDRYVHRVVGVTRQNGLPVVKTKGDNNGAVDPWLLRIDSAQVPQVVADAPNVGRLSLLTQGAGVRIVLILLVAGFALVGIKRALLDPR